MRARELESMCDVPVDERHMSDDGTGGDRTEQDRKDEAFAKWFHDNGGSYPKINWPSRDTVGSVRGTIALEDIATNEPMLFVPQNIMISPPVCHAHPELGPVFAKHKAFFARDDDTMLAVFVMYERARGVESFWHPYLDMLPWPGSVADWTHEELEELQDLSLLQDATMRPIKIKAKYDSLMGLLVGHHPELFSREVHTLHRFTFAWMSIQARAFGRRLPWSALVPFADCLNHTNVATKYDFDVEGTGIFRLMPTGTNCYPKGSEVFNSYGRRNNRFLLMEYGFALENNEWDTCNVTVALEEMRGGGQSTSGKGRVAPLSSLRGLEEGEKKARKTEGSAGSDGGHADAQREVVRSKLELLNKFSISGRRQFRLRWGRLNQDLMSFCRLKAMSAEECADRQNALRFWSDGVSVSNELSAQGAYIAEMREQLARFPTTLEEDEEILAAAALGDKSRNRPGPRLIAATRFRHCKKRILRNHIKLVEAMRPLMELLAEQESQDLDPTDPRGLQVHYMKSYVNKLCTIASRGPSERRRLEEQERREMEERKARAERMEVLRREREEQQRRMIRAPTSDAGTLEEKSRVAIAQADNYAGDCSTDEEDAFQPLDSKTVARERVRGSSAAGPVAPSSISRPQVEAVVADRTDDELERLRRELAQAKADHAAAAASGGGVAKGNSSASSD